MLHRTEDRVSLTAEGDPQHAANASTTHTDGSVHNNSTPWATATMGMVANHDGHTTGMALDGNIQSIDRAELKSTIIMAERGAKRIHTDSMYVISIWRKVTKFLRERGRLTGAQLQNARSRWQKLVASPNTANHDLVNRLQTCVQTNGEVLIQKVKGTHNLKEAEAGEWPLDRLGNLNADAAANRVQLAASSSLPQAQQMVENWKERIQQHGELLSMLLDVSKAFMDKRKTVEREMANPLEDPWQAQWPRATHGINKSRVGLVWTLAVAKQAETRTWGGPNRNTKQCDRTVTYIELAIDCYLLTMAAQMQH